MKTEPNDPINPIVEEVEHGMTGSTMDATSYGLTKREYFAGLALQGLLALRGDMHLDRTAQSAVECADALIAELNKNV